MLVQQWRSDLCSPSQFASSNYFSEFTPRRKCYFSNRRCGRIVTSGPILAATRPNVEKIKKPSACTADELHYVNVHNSDWRLALWRYFPSPQAPKRNHPLLLLSGFGTNAIGYDVSPESSFARHMSGQGYDTWILELRGAGLSAQSMELGEGLSQGNRSAFVGKIRGFIQKLVDVVEDGRQSYPSLFLDAQLNLSTALNDIQKQVDVVLEYDWDFDHYVEEDVPAAMEYIKANSKPKDGKLLAIGHSMGGILLYAILARCGFEGRDSGLASITTLGSSLDYSSSSSFMKLVFPPAELMHALNVPAVPLGALLAAMHPYATRPPYLMSWLKPLFSTPEMLHPELFEKLILNNFCTVPTKLISQLSSTFDKKGLCDRSGTFFYKNHLGKSKVPILVLAADQDLICSPQDVYETAKLIPEHLLTYKVFGQPGGPHYAHYDLVCGRMAKDQVYPCIVEFLNHHDAA